MVDISDYSICTGFGRNDIVDLDKDKIPQEEMYQFETFTDNIIADMKKTGGFYYLGSPYSHEDYIVVNDRFIEAEKATAWLTLKGIPVFGAINHSHPLVKYGFQGTKWEHWKHIDEVFIEKCDGVIILGLIGWSKSHGVNEEIKMARKQNKPIYFMKKESPSTECYFNYSLSIH